MGLIATVGAKMSPLRKRLSPRMDATMGTNLTGLFGLYFGQVFTALQTDPRQNRLVLSYAEAFAARLVLGDF
jgi:hypothetical protein